VTVAAVGLAHVAANEASLRAEASAQQLAIAQLQEKVGAMNARQALEVDWASVAATVEPSVVTVDAGDALGSGWVVHTDAGGSELVTNFHVVADAWTSGDAKVAVRAGDKTMSGTIVRIDRNDDLAVIHVGERLPALTSIATRPRIGTTVMAIGSPLGLDGTISVGVVSGYRSLEGSDFLQFSAPISPGNSGGPVVDAKGRVVAIASAKLIGTGVEALSLAIPVQVACAELVACGTS
jgi:putative serine protease PepD